MSKKSNYGKLRYVILDYNCGGKVCNQMSNISKPHPTSKIDCKMRINVTYINEVFKVLTIDNIHNYDLSLKKSIFFSCNREVSEFVKRVLYTNNLASIEMNMSFVVIMQGANGYKELPFLDKDCHNYINKARQLRLEKDDTKALGGYFKRMQCKNYEFLA